MGLVRPPRRSPPRAAVAPMFAAVSQTNRVVVRPHADGRPATPGRGAILGRSRSSNRANGPVDDASIAAVCPGGVPGPRGANARSRPDGPVGMAACDRILVALGTSAERRRLQRRGRRWRSWMGWAIAGLGDGRRGRSADTGRPVGQKVETDSQGDEQDGGHGGRGAKRKRSRWAALQWRRHAGRWGRRSMRSVTMSTTRSGASVGPSPSQWPRSRSMSRSWVMPDRPSLTAVRASASRAARMARCA